jgi:hypothetical protein
VDDAQLLGELGAGRRLPPVADAVRCGFHRPGEEHLVLRRDLARPVVPPPAEEPLAARRATPSDLARVWDLLADLPRREWARRALLVERRVGSCHVAVAPGGEIRLAQWLVPCDQAHLVRAHTALPPPRAGEALLCCGFAPRPSRVTPAAVAAVAERAVDLDARWVLTVVPVEDAAALEACLDAGFDPYRLKRDRRVLFRRRTRYAPIPAGLRPG